jgi:hypothetical protein
MITFIAIDSAPMTSILDHHHYRLHDFNFLFDKWNILNKRLKERLQNCTDWTEFHAEMEPKSILNGLAFIDEIKTSNFGKEFIGFSYRMLNPKTNLWRIYWADTASPENYLKEQVVGGFKDRIGKFFGKEFYEGKEYKLRFTWKKEAEHTAR